jgi:hypothetical protein
MTTPTSSGLIGGWGQTGQGRALANENRPQLNSATTFNNLIIVNKRGWLGSRPILLSERAYSSSKRLIVRHKVIQQREQFCSPLDELAFQFTVLDQFDLPVG